MLVLSSAWQPALLCCAAAHVCSGLQQFAFVLSLVWALCAMVAVSLPEANSMEPRQLQQAVALTMAELRKGRVRRLLDWGKLLYRCACVCALMCALNGSTMCTLNRSNSVLWDGRWLGCVKGVRAACWAGASCCAGVQARPTAG